MTVKYGWTYCTYAEYPGSFRDNTPPEYCPNEVEPGEDFCVEHLHVLEADLDKDFDRLMARRGK